ncbi:hypothetical protein SFC07_10975 [Corynebacterium callunae]|uniref:hypothetical protein n=1 Tax=Corynebacterium callunae TaxID=1721 RepID=UPI003981F186
MIESKLEKAQKLLQFIYDFEANHPNEEIESEIEANRADVRESEITYSDVDFLAEDPFGSGFGGSSFDRNDALRKVFMTHALRLGLSKEEIAAAGKWLVERGLAKSRNSFVFLGDLQLTRAGEDLIDLGISIKDWYFGTYREAFLNRTLPIASSEEE